MFRIRKEELPIVFKLIKKNYRLSPVKLSVSMYLYIIMWM